MNIKNTIHILIGIDDTDNPESRGTGYHSRQLAHQLESTGHAVVKGITRHQLFVDPAIRYTSQNSSACIDIQTDKLQLITELCEEYLIENSAPGSDAGLCIVNEKDHDQSIIDWGKSAKSVILNMDDARALAKEKGIYLRGYTGNHEGIIGALAAVGLRFSGNDGRFIWRRGKKELREMKAGIMDTQKLILKLELDEIQNLHGERPKAGDRIYINDWVRPILKKNKTILIAQKIENNDEYEWKLTGKEIIRIIS
jgi:hypothetical protein